MPCAPFPAMQGADAAPAVSLPRKLGELTPTQPAVKKSGGVDSKSLQDVAKAVQAANGVVATANGVVAAAQQAHATANSAASYFSCWIGTGWQVVSTIEQKILGTTCNHGNHCGASCVSNKPAVDDLDAAYQEHDKCLAASPPSGTCRLLGSSNCACDEMLNRKAQAVRDGWLECIQCAG